MKLIEKIKSNMRKKFRIVKNDLVCPEAFHPLWYRIEQRHTTLFFIHWWSTPGFAPPHTFEKISEAQRAINNEYPDAIVSILINKNK